MVSRTNMVAQQIDVSDAKPNDLCLLIVEREKQLL